MPWVEIKFQTCKHEKCKSFSTENPKMVDMDVLLEPHIMGVGRLAEFSVRRCWQTDNSIWWDEESFSFPGGLLWLQIWLLGSCSVCPHRFPHCRGFSFCLLHEQTQFPKEIVSVFCNYLQSPGPKKSWYPLTRFYLYISSRLVQYLSVEQLFYLILCPALCVTSGFWPSGRRSCSAGVGNGELICVYSLKVRIHEYLQTEQRNTICNLMVIWIS